MSDHDAVMIPYFAHEGEVSRLERINKRLWVLVLVVFLALVGTNAGWIIYESQFQTETQTTEVEALQLGERNLVSGGDISIGTDSQD